ncbi:hypothetical protein P9C27_18835 [Bacillus vallismortis]|uniref:hypothetical protein n=1 Tax=Bacillus vallismortis TaxID=72361 RepID=UPI002DB5A0A1|nr:hypothetical protein [Bacillus vallismortis]MEC1270521.1 hypothetical protein [Bacillus vallismortis]
MDIIKTILTSWPLAIVIIVFAIRGSLKKIIENRLFSFKVGNIEVTFDRLIEEVDESLSNESQTPEINEDSTTDKESNDEENVKTKTKTSQEKLAEQKNARFKEEVEKKRISKLISEDPEGAMKTLWSLIYGELKRLGERKGLDTRQYVRFDDVIYELVENKIISKSFYSAIMALNRIRSLMDTASHNGYKWTNDDAHSYYGSCRVVLRELRSM